MSLANLITEISLILEQLFVINSRLIKKHSRDCWRKLFSVCTENYCIDVVSYKIFSVFSLKSIKDWSIDKWELQLILSLIWLLLRNLLWNNSWSWRIGLRMGFLELLLLLSRWSLLIILIIILLISILTSSSSTTLITSSSSSSSIISSVVSWLSIALAHISCLKLLLLSLILLIWNILDWLWMHHCSWIVFSVLKSIINLYLQINI